MANVASINSAGAATLAATLEHSRAGHDDLVDLAQHVRFFDLVRKKYPEMQPWFYAEWTNRNRTPDLATAA